MTWLYRLIVFFSIALVVYHAFFKALGIALLGVEFGWFIVRPIGGEVAACWRRRAALHWRPQTIRSAALGVLLLAFVLLPWHSGVNAPAVFGPNHAQGLYSPEAGYLSGSATPPRNRQSVRAGEVLAVLASPDLEHKLRQAEAQEALLGWEVEQQAFEDRLREQGVALRRHWDAARQTVAGLTSQIGQLTIRAPFDGTVEAVEDGLSAGTWLPRGERLFDVVGPTGIKGEAFVGESDVSRIAAAQAVTFVASLPEMSALRCRVTAVDRVNLTTLDEPSIASPYGGPVPAELQPGTRQLVPLRATYRVRLAQCAGPAILARQVVRTATIGDTRESFAWRGVRALLALLESEAGM